MTGSRVSSDAAEGLHPLAAARRARQAGDKGRAIELARRAMELASDAPGPLFMLCSLLLETGDQAASDLLPRLHAFPGYAPGWHDLGTALLAAGQPEAAAVAFSRAIAAEPAFLAPHLGKAAAQAALGRLTAAATAYEAAEAIAPHKSDIPYRRGLCLREAGDAAAAGRAFERAVALDPGFAQAWFSLGLLRQDARQPDAAVAAYRAALAARPDFHEAALNLGAACQDAGDLDGALDAYAVAYRLRPAAFGRIAQSVVSSRTGRLWLDLDVLRDVLARRA
jgi:tetratricopeptide (TPR) repeat protein